MNLFESSFCLSPNLRVSLLLVWLATLFQRALAV
jgi:hypothetical protein